MLNVNIIMFTHEAMCWASVNNFCMEKWCTVYKAWYLENVTFNEPCFHIILCRSSTPQVMNVDRCSFQMYV